MTIDLSALVDVFILAAPFAVYVALAMSLLIKPLLNAIPKWEELSWSSAIVNLITAALSFGICWWRLGSVNDAALPALITFSIAVAGYEGIKNVLSGIGFDITNVWKA